MKLAILKILKGIDLLEHIVKCYSGRLKFLSKMIAQKIQVLQLLAQHFNKVKIAL